MGRWPLSLPHPPAPASGNQPASSPEPDCVRSALWPAPACPSPAPPLIILHFSRPSCLHKGDKTFSGQITLLVKQSADPWSSDRCLCLSPGHLSQNENRAFTHRSLDSFLRKPHPAQPGQGKYSTDTPGKAVFFNRAGGFIHLTDIYKSVYLHLLFLCFMITFGLPRIEPQNCHLVPTGEQSLACRA